jgi:GT2 family glycosyltransferase
MATLLASAVVGADPALIGACVNTLRSSAGSHEVAVRVIVNWRSPTGTGNPAHHAFEDSAVSVIENPAPAGFATNHNRALQNSAADYLLLANDDLVFHPESVARCLDFLERPENSDVAALSPRLLNADGTLQRSTYGFPTVTRALLDLSGLRGLIPHNSLTDVAAQFASRGEGRSRFWRHDSIQDVDTFRGAAMFVRARAWTEVGPMCEIATVGGEVAEWHRRCRDKGWRVVYFPEASVTHFGSRTVGTEPLLRTEYLKGYLVFFSRHGKRASVPLFRTFAILISGARLAAAAVATDRVGVRLWRSNLSVLFNRKAWQT